MQDDTERTAVASNRSRSCSPPLAIAAAVAPYNGVVGYGRRTSRRDSSSMSPLQLRRARTSGDDPDPNRRPSSLRRRIQSTGTSGGITQTRKSTLLQDYRVGHANVQELSPIARKVSAPFESTAISPTGFLARKYPVQRPVAGAALDLTALCDSSDSSNGVLDDDHSGQSVEEMIQFRLRNPAAHPPPPPPKPPAQVPVLNPSLPIGKFSKHSNHRPLPSIVETDADAEAEEKREDIPPKSAVWQNSVSSLANSIQSEILAGPNSNLGKMDSISSFADSAAEDELLDYAKDNGSFMISSRFSEVSTASTAASTMDHRLSELSILSEATDAPTNKDLLNPTVSSPPPPLFRMSNDQEEEEEEEMSHRIVSSAASSVASSRSHSPSSHTGASASDSTSQAGKPNHTTTKLPSNLHPTARILQAAAKAVQDLPPASRRRTRRTSSGEPVRRDGPRGMPGFKRTSTMDAASPMRDQSHSSSIRASRRTAPVSEITSPLPDSNNLMNGSHRRKGRFPTSDASLDDSGMDHSGKSGPTRGRGIGRSKSSDGTVGALPRMRRAGRRSDNGNGEDPEGPVRRTPTRTRSSDGAIPLGTRPRIVRRTGSDDDNNQTRKNALRRSRSTVVPDDDVKESNRRSLSPTRRATKKDDGFGSSHPAMFSTSRIKRFNKNDMDASQNFGDHGLSRLMNNGGLAIYQTIK